MIKENLEEFYKNRRVLVTGHTGFKGSWLSLWLETLGANVIGYSLEPSTDPNTFSILGLDNKINSIIGDIRDYEKLLSVIKFNKPEVVFHLAAQPIVSTSYNEPQMTFDTNVMGALNIFEAIRNTESVKTVVCITSDKCYENKEWLWGYRETDALGGYDPYSASKACVEILTSSYRRSFFENIPNSVKIATARAGNVIGGGDWSPNRIIPDAVRAFSKKQELVIRNPGSTRPWQHVIEPLFGYLILAKKLSTSQNEYATAWNFGPNSRDVMTVEDVIKIAQEIWGEGASYVIDRIEHHNHEAHYLYLDCSKAFNQLNWSTILNPQVTLEHTINWYKKYYCGQTDMYNYSLEQINMYMKLVAQSNIIRVGK